MLNTHTTRTSCRLCGGSFRDVLSLGPIYVSTFLDVNEEAPAKIPIDLVECVKCGVMQLRDTVNGDVMYRQYWYQSGLNTSMVAALQNVVDETLRRVDVTEGDIIVDIGANDGTLLSLYSKGLRSKTWLVGYEPSNLYTLGEQHAHYMIHDYFNAPAYHKTFTKPAKIITSVAMFYDLEDPHSFVEQAKSVLHEHGVWTIQLMDLLSMIITNDFPNLCHEHLEYYKLSDIRRLMQEHGLEIFDLEYNAVNGASLRVYVGHKGKHQITELVHNAQVNEDDFFEQLGDVGNYFKKSVENVKQGVVAFINYANSMGKTVAVMGASTKGNTILQYFNLGPDDIIHAAEVNADKFGKRTVGTNIPIIPEAESLAMKPDYYLILPWGFINNFIARNTDYLLNGGAFIVPLPAPAVIAAKEGVIEAWPI